MRTVTALTRLKHWLNIIYGKLRHSTVPPFKQFKFAFMLIPKH